MPATFLWYQASSETGTWLFGPALYGDYNKTLYKDPYLEVQDTRVIIPISGLYVP